jgi:hypothetical protein
MIRAKRKNGQIIPEEPVDWPDGCDVFVSRTSLPELVGAAEDLQADDPESVARWLEWYDSLEPLIFTPQEEAEIAACRQQVKEYTLENTERDIDGVFQ